MNKLIILMLISTKIFANSIEISANEVVINKQSSISHYIGEVVFSQANITLRAHEVKITKDGASDYQVVALGNTTQQAQFTQNGVSDIRSRADKIVYFTKQQFIQLFGNAMLSQNGNAFNGEKINYDAVNDKVLMSGEGSTRVKLKIKL